MYVFVVDLWLEINKGMINEIVVELICSCLMLRMYRDLTNNMFGNCLVIYCFYYIGNLQY